MSKELRAFRKICKNLNSYEFTDEYKKNKKLIETALKESNELKDKMGITDVVKEDFFQLWKEHEALEIIKELVNSYEIDELPDSWFELLRTWLNKVLSKDKLELLKEQLL